MYVPEIISMKEKLEGMKKDGLIAEWELPYENLLTRLTAAIFFVTPSNDAEGDKIWNVFSDTKDFSYRINTEKKLSGLMYRVTFNEEEKKATEAKQAPASMS